MRSNCQLFAENRCFATRVSRAVNDRRSVAFLVLVLAACGDSGSGESGDGSDDDDSTAGESATDPGPTEAATTGGSSPTTVDPSGDTEPADVGPNFGLLTFTLYPADASGSPAQLGIAGAWRTAEFTTDDFFAVRALSSFFPRPPATDDTLEHTGPGVYDWGFNDSWLGLGNGMRLGSALACLQVYKDRFPLYLGDDAENLDPACAPDPAAWQPATAHDLVVYGNDEFADEIRPGVRTPAALSVTAPDVTAFDFAVDTSQDLAVTWDANGEDGDIVVIRMWDQFGEMFTVRAADDGSYAISKDALAELSLGAATLTVAREHITEVGLAAGALRVVAGHEVWAYPDLF